MPKCPKCQHSFIIKRRSNPQNELYWGWIVTPFSNHLKDRGYNQDDTHELLKSECNYKIVYDKDINGNFIERKIAQSTTILTTIDFKEYIERCLKYAANEGCYLIMPEDLKDSNENI